MRESLILELYLPFFLALLGNDIGWNSRRCLGAHEAGEAAGPEGGGGGRARQRISIEEYPHDAGAMRRENL